MPTEHASIVVARGHYRAEDTETPVARAPLAPDRGKFGPAPEASPGCAALASAVQSCSWAAAAPEF